MGEERDEGKEKSYNDYTWRACVAFESGGGKMEDEEEVTPRTGRTSGGKSAGSGWGHKHTRTCSQEAERTAVGVMPVACSIAPAHPAPHVNVCACMHFLHLRLCRTLPPIGSASSLAQASAKIGRSLEVLVEELPLVEAHPPLGGLVLAVGIHGLNQPVAGLLPELGQVLTDLVCTGGIRAHG